MAPYGFQHTLHGVYGSAMNNGLSFECIILVGEHKDGKSGGYEGLGVIIDGC